MSETKQSEIIKTSLENIKTMLDANTVTGEPITTPSGTTIIPVSKISVGYVSGGLDYLKKDAPTRDGKPLGNNFGGGGGTGVSVTPVAFIVIDAEGKTEILNMNQSSFTPEDTVSKTLSFVERSPELIERFKDVFKKNKEE
ncbi:MAG: sporulation protein YtfJ [Clostridia bacterium]|nr:sporulation protein YtfJ [Clostridia bacterium]